MKRALALLLTLGLLVLPLCACHDPEEWSDTEYCPEVLDKIRGGEEPSQPVDAPYEPTREEFLQTLDFDRIHASILSARDADEDTSAPFGEELYQKVFSVYDSYEDPFGFCAVDLKTGTVLSHGLDRELFAASIIKASYVFWVCHEIDAGRGTLEEILPYRQSDRRGGTGAIRDLDGTEYSVSECIHYIFAVSDNDAYSMLNRRFGTDGYNTFLRSMDMKSMFLGSDSLWGYLTPRDAALLFCEILRYAASGEGCSGLLLDEMAAAEDNWIAEALKEKTACEVPMKYGWVNGSFSECAAVLDREHPMLLSVYTTGNRTDGDIAYLKEQASCLFDCLASASSPAGTDGAGNTGLPKEKKP